MKFLILLMSLAHAQTEAPKITRETIYSGKLNLKAIQTHLIVSKFYEVKLIKEPKPQFQYSLKPEIKPEEFNAGLYKAKEFTLTPTIDSPPRFR